MLIGLGVGHVAALESKSDPVTRKDCDQGSGRQWAPEQGTSGPWGATY